MRLSLLTLALAAILVSCKDDPAPQPTHQNATVSFALAADGAPVAPGGAFSLWDTTTVNLDIFRMYLSRISFRNASGTWVEAKDVILLEANKPETMTYTWSIPAGTYTAIRFGIGLDSLLNASDPATFPPTHPLASAKGMHWSWAQMYRFITTEGRAFSGGAQTNYAHHPGRNDFYRTYTLERSIAGGQNLAFDINIKTLYDGPDGQVNPMTVQGIHVTPEDVAFAIIMMNNAPAAFIPKN